MRRLWGVLGVMLALSLGVSAQPTPSDPWRAWLYDYVNGQMILVDRAGELDRVTLPLVAGYDTYPTSGVAVSPNGQLFAYTAGRSGSFDVVLTMYDTVTDRIVATYPRPGIAYTSFDFAPRRAFHPSGRQLMFGYSLDGSDWEIVLIGLDTFGLSAVLSSTEPAAAGLPNGFGVTPVPQAVYPDGRIAFTLVRGGTDGSGGFEAYTWDPAVGAVGSTGGFGEIDLDTFDPTGESVMSGMDARFPATAVDALPFGQTNVLSYYSNATDLTTPFYTDPVLTFSNPTFVMNGSYVVVNAYDGVNEPEYRLIDRDGLRLGTLAIAPAPYDVAGTRDGFLYLQRIGATPALFSVNLRDGAIDIGETDSALFIGTDNTAPQVMWVGHTDPINPYFSVESAYTRWQDLATGTGGSAPTTPTDAVLTVGGEATIRTTEGDALNVRSGPGIGFAIVLKAQPGTVVTLQEGPTAADGFTWWRIRLPDGSEGWAVQEAENEQTLVPGAGSYTPDVPSGANPSVGSALTIGDFAYVSVSGRIDALRLRNAPTTSGGVIVLMPNLTPVTVIGGPATADGFTWWELRTAEGNVGWAAEVIGSERVLVKGLPFNAAATPVPSGDGGGQPQPATTPES